ncbi:MAG TPA: hypothetical protein VIS99_11855 [Terrimicrobiaceae bacterium]
MNDELSKQLNEHFSELEASHAAANERSRTYKEKEQALKDEFQKIKKEIIQPAMIQIRDALLARNYPAAIIIEDQRVGAEPDWPYIAFHASNDIKHASVVGHNPMFRASFRWFIGQVEFSATRMMVKGVPQNAFSTKLTLSDLTRQTIDDLLLDSIRGMFPIIRAEQ